MPRLVLVVLLASLACATPMRSGRIGLEESPLAAALDQSPMLEDLAMSFYDPESTGLFTAEGPFRVVDSHAGGVDLVGFDPNHARPAIVTVFADRGQLWARMRVDHREFLTRLR